MRMCGLVLKMTGLAAADSLAFTTQQTLGCGKSCWTCTECVFQHDSRRSRVRSRDGCCIPEHVSGADNTRAWKVVLHLLLSVPPGMSPLS
jgi:hypothetical protein